MRSTISSTFILGLALFVGCGETPPAEVASNPGETGGVESTPGFVAQRPAKQYSDPRHSVNDFLVAVKSGDDKTATALLTTQAQREAWTNGLAISGEGFPDANFEVSEVEYLNDNQVAHVLSVWENKTNYSDRKSFQCVWMLRAEPHGWCIAGMATKFLDHLDPVQLNFENQAEMQKRQQWAQREIIKHAELQQQQQQAAATAARTQQVGTHGPRAQSPNVQTGQVQQPVGQQRAGQQQAGQQQAGQQQARQQQAGQQPGRYGQQTQGAGQQATRPTQPVR